MSAHAVFQAHVTQTGKGIGQKDVQKTGQSYDQIAHGTTMMEHAGTMTKCTQPAIPYMNIADWKYQLLFVSNSYFVKSI